MDPQLLAPPDPPGDPPTRANSFLEQLNIVDPDVLREQMKSVLRRLACTFIMLSMCVAKILVLVLLNERVPLIEESMKGAVWLAIASFVSMLPLYYASSNVTCYDMFRVFACVIMFIEAASLFLMLGCFEKGDWVFVEIPYLLAMCALLGLIEKMFEEKKRLEVSGHHIPHVFYGTSSRSDERHDGNDDDDDEEENFWRRIAICRSRRY